MALPTEVKIGTKPSGIPSATGDLVSCTKMSAITTQTWYVLGKSGPKSFTYMTEPNSGQMRIAAKEEAVADDANYLISNLTWTESVGAPDYTDVSWVEI